MNNLIIKSVIILVIFFDISFVDSHSIDKRSSSTSGVIIGPDTPVYYLEYPHDKYIKVQRYVNKFEASPSYNYYYNSEKKSNDTFFPKILVMVDWNNGIGNKTQEQNILNEVLAKWNKVDKYFEQLDNPKIKLDIAGVVIPTKQSIWEPAICYFISFLYAYVTTNANHPMDCFQNVSATNRMANWLNDNAGQFESLKYDLFIFMSNVKMNTSRNVEDCRYDCQKTNNFGAKIGSDNRPLGRVIWNTYVFPKSAAYIIASILGVNSDRELGCESGHIMDASQARDDETWSECSKRAFRSMVNNNKYTCLHQIIDDEDDYDL